MGKSKRRDRPRDRAGPTGGRPSKAPTDPETAALREKSVLPALRDLTSIDSNQKVAATAAIANLIENSKCRKLFLKERIVRTLLEQTINDSELEVVVGGWGILNNLLLEEDWTLGVELFRKDVLTPLDSAARNVISSLESELKAAAPSKARQKLIWNLADALLNILSSLSETNQEVVEAISALSTVPNLQLDLLVVDGVPPQVRRSAALCLHNITADNDLVTKKILENIEWADSVLRLSTEQSSIGIAANGVLHNIYLDIRQEEGHAALDKFSDEKALPLLNKLLRRYVEASGHENNSNGDSTQQYEQSDLEILLQIIGSVATEVQETVEGPGIEDSEIFEGFEDDDSEVEVMDGIEGDDPVEADALKEADDTSDVDDADMEMVVGEESGEPTAVEADAVGGIQTTIQVLIKETTPLVLQLVSNGPASMQNQAIITLNNISWAVSAVILPSLEPSSPIQQIWRDTVQKIWTACIAPVLASNTADVTLASNITGLAWALARSVKGGINLSADEPRKFMALYQAASTLEGPQQVNGKQEKKHRQDEPAEEDGMAEGLGVKCIGVLGSLALCPGRVDLNREIGVFLLTIVSTMQETPAENTVQALNQIFDIYADQDYDYDEAVFWRDGFMGHLEAAITKARKMSKTIDKRKLPDLRQRADEAVLNLTRFIKYKKDEKAARSS